MFDFDATSKEKYQFKVEINGETQLNIITIQSTKAGEGNATFGFGEGLGTVQQTDGTWKSCVVQRTDDPDPLDGQKVLLEVFSLDNQCEVNGCLFEGMVIFKRIHKGTPMRGSWINRYTYKLA